MRSKSFFFLQFPTRNLIRVELRLTSHGCAPQSRARDHNEEFAMAGPVRFINPKTLHKPPTYTQVVEATGPGRTIFISGQLGGGIDGKLVGSDFRSQAVQVFENLKAGLAAVGANFKN